MHSTPVTVAGRALLRPATSGDIEAIGAIWHRGWLEAHLGHVPSELLPHRRLDDLRARLPYQLATTTVAVVESDVVGFVTVHEDEVEQLYVDPSARGTSVAASLLAHAEKVIGTQFGRAWLAVVAGNLRARSFYERRGWSDVGSFDEPRLDAERRHHRCSSPAVREGRGQSESDREEHGLMGQRTRRQGRARRRRHPGRGTRIAVELGAAGATVYCTGRTTRQERSEMDRPETIEETAELVEEAGGKGIAVQVDHLEPDQVAALIQRIDDEQGALHVLVNDIWGATTMEWDKTVWESSLDIGLRTLRLAVDTHAITAHFALPLLIRSPGGLVVEVTDGTDEYNSTNYRVSFFYDLAKAANLRMAYALGHELARHGSTAVAAHARLAALRGDARGLRCDGSELARCHRAHPRTSP